MKNRLSVKLMATWIFRIGISVVALVLVIDYIDFNDITARLSRLGHLEIELLVGLTGILWFLRSWRLQVILKSQSSSPSLLACFQGQAIEITGNLFLPLRGGDVARWYVLSKLMPETTMSHQIGAYALEKLLELGSLIVVIVIFSIQQNLIPVTGYRIIFLITGFAVLTILVLFRRVFSKLKTITGGLINKIITRIENEIRNIESGFASIRTPYSLALIVVQTGFLRVLNGLFFFILLNSMGYDFGLWEAIFLYAIVMIGTIIPAAPGYIGTYELMVVFGLGILGIESESAMTFALVAHAWQILTWIAIGFVALITIPDGVKAAMRS